MTLPLPERIRSAEITLIVASASFDIWWVYANRETRDLDAMNVFPTFFTYDQEAHFRNVIVSLHSLYDDFDKTPTLTIKSLIHSLDPAMAKPIWRIYQSVHVNVEKVRTLRHNVFAHRNATKTYSQIFQDAGLKADDLRKLIADTLQMLTMVAEAVGAPTPTLSPFLTKETSDLLQVIQGQPRQ